MQTAIIVIATILGFGLILFFVARLMFGRKEKARRGEPLPRGFKGVKQWFINHLPTKRRLIQVYAALLYNANIKGFISGNIYTSETTKYMCVPGLNCYSCPGAVGACPLGAFQNALAESNTRAPYYVLGILALFGLTVARTVCGFLCPVGLCQELLYKIRTPKLKKSRATRILSYFKYVLLALAIILPLMYGAMHIPLPAFCKYICPAGTLGGAVMLLINPNNSNLFGQLGWQFTWKFSLLVAFIVASVFIFRVFCRFFCPLGAIYGFFNRFALIGVDVDKNSCTDCGLCVSHCKMDVKRVGDHECINCGECMAVCPTKAISWKGSKIFLRGSAVQSSAPELKPLAVGEGNVTLAPQTDTAEASVVVENIWAANAAVESAGTADSISAPVERDEAANVGTTAKPVNDKSDADKTPDKIEKTGVEQKSKARRPSRFWYELAAWIVAAIVLVTALVCYNFVDSEKPYTPPAGDVETGNAVGDMSPDFTVALYGTGDSEFNLYSHRGQMVVVNFWATWCTPCVEELPYFNALAENHPEIKVVAVHGKSTTEVEGFIDAKGWRDYKLSFAQDNLDGSQCLTFRMYGGTSFWPMTVIIGADGTVLYNDIKSFKSYDQLEELILSLTENVD